MEGYNIFIDQLDQVIEKYPNFGIAEKNDNKFLRGNLQIIDKNDEHWESYQLEIKHHSNFPKRFPKVYEISNKIPKIADWHIYDEDKSCCIDVLPSEIIKCKDGLSLCDFIERELVPYFFNQTHRRVEGYYVGGEYSHGVLGIYEFYSIKLNTSNNIRKTLSLMHFIATNSRPNRSNKCFCGSGEVFRHCHMKAYDELECLGKRHLINDINLLYKWSGFKAIDTLNSSFKFRF